MRPIGTKAAILINESLDMISLSIGRLGVTKDRTIRSTVRFYSGESNSFPTRSAEIDSRGKRRMKMPRARPLIVFLECGSKGNFALKGSLVEVCKYALEHSSTTLELTALI